MNFFSLKKANYESSDAHYLWQSFLRRSQKRVLIALGYTILLAISAIIFKNVWLILLGEIVFWALSKIWFLYKKKADTKKFEVTKHSIDVLTEEVQRAEKETHLK